MTDSEKPARSESQAPDDDPEVRSWLRGALVDEPSEPVDVLRGVQKKLRERSGGKFYADPWSTAKEPPTSTFLVTTVLMLVVVAVVYAVLTPLRGQPEPVRMTPPPVDVVAPAPR